jgi:hypothetical protein
MKKMMLAAALALALAGCAIFDPPLPIVRPPFPEAEYAALNKTGAAIVTGQAFLRTRSGDVKLGAGSPVLLIPVTSYSTFSYDFRNQYYRLSKEDPRVYASMHVTTADAWGRFTLKNIADGEYYIRARVTWEVPTGDPNYPTSTQGGSIWKTVSVRNGEPVEVMVTEEM